MRDPVEKYLEDVLCYADLAAPDEKNVRAELSEHLHALADSFTNSKPTEIYAMLKDQFGKPGIVGRSIAAAKGRVRTYFKKSVRKWPLRIGICLILAFSVRYAVAEVFYVTGAGGAPAVPTGSRIFVYKLSKSFNPGDVVVYKTPTGENYVGVIVRQNPTGDWLIERNKGTPHDTIHAIAPKDIVGRVFLNTR